MIRRVVPAGLCLLWGLASHGQIAFNGTYVENFDALGASGTSYPDGWSAVRAAGSGTLGAPLALGLSTGSSTGGGVYNVGLSGDGDRALGSLSSAATVPRFGAQWRNDSSAAVTQLTLDATAEQWRSGASDSVNEVLVFEYSLNALDINDATALWTALPGFDLQEALTSSTSAGAVDGNLTENQVGMHAQITGLDWAPGGTLTFRWTDTDDAGSDGMYALDGLSLNSVSAVPEPSVILLGAAAGLVLAARRRFGRS
jgi:trimeric autotransporter adhesin